MVIGELIRPIVEALVDRPNEVEILEHTIVEGKKLSLVVTVHPDDLGKLVGRKGVNARAFKSLLSSLSGKHRCTYTLDFGGNFDGG